MRKIECEMNASIMLKRNWKKGNTSVLYQSNLNKTGVFLHGNHIADYYHAECKLVVNRYTLRMWPTSTAKSRLKALGANVYTHNHITYLNDEPV